jgi:ATP phosphoribosyltransferase regulatory subunit
MNADLIKVLSAEEYAALQLRALYAGKGFTQYKMSKFEEYDLYAQNKDFLVSGSVITFTDTDGRLMALKPDVTLSIIKNTDVDPCSTTRLFYNENVYRVAKGTNSFKEIPQAGVECMGRVDTDVLAEVLTMAAESLALVADEFVLEVSSLDVVDAVLAAAGLDESAKAKAKRALADKNVGQLTSLAKDCDLGEKETAAIALLAETYGAPCEVMQKLNSLCITDEISAAVAEFVAVLDRLLQSGFSSKISVDFSVVNDGAYYNGIAFRGFALGIATRVVSGGQYDRLIEKMGKKARAVGFAVYLDEIGRVKGAKNG